MGTPEDSSRRRHVVVRLLAGHSRFPTRTIISIVEMLSIGQEAGAAAH